MLADASLFFCPPDQFGGVWHNIEQCLVSGGIFSGSFLGTDDSMAQAGYNKDEIWPDVLPFNESQVKRHFTKFKIMRFTEHKESGKTPLGSEHHWHIFSVVAKKI